MTPIVAAPAQQQPITAKRGREGRGEDLTAQLGSERSECVSTATRDRTPQLTSERKSGEARRDHPSSKASGSKNHHVVSAGGLRHGGFFCNLVPLAMAF